MKDNNIVLPPDANGGVSITPPQGCEVDKVEVVDGVLTVTFKPQESQLPKSWEEFCEGHSDYNGECYIGPASNIAEVDEKTWARMPGKDRNLLPDRATAEAVLALIQLIQLRNAYNGDWVPDWEDAMATKHCIFFEKSSICLSAMFGCPELLFFKTAELRDEFLRNFRPLINKLKPLYGIKEGGSDDIL